MQVVYSSETMRAKVQATMQAVRTIPCQPMVMLLAYNGVNLDSYNRKITFQHLTEEGIRNIGNAVVTMAENEQLEAHANAMRLRVNSLKQ